MSMFESDDELEEEEVEDDEVEEVDDVPVLLLNISASCETASEVSDPELSNSSSSCSRLEK